MRKTKATKTKSNTNYWDRVYVITGEPQSCQFAIPAVIEQSGAPGIRRYHKDAKASVLRTAFSAFTIADKPDAVMLINPSSEQLKVCQEAIEEGPFLPPALIVFSPGDIDGRLTFYKSANKLKRVYSYDYVQKTQKSAFMKYLDEWQAGTGIKLKPDAREWLYSNAPTASAKIAQGTLGKRDTEVIDLEWLESELEKVAIVRQSEKGDALLEDVQDLCVFDQISDIWEFVEAAVAGRSADVFKMLDKMTKGSDATGALHLLLSQLKFLINLKSTPGDNEHVLASMMSLDKYVGKYLLPDWSELLEKPATTAVNPWRVRKALDSTQEISLDSLTAQYQAVAFAIKDLRFGFPPDILMPYLVLALSGRIRYEACLTG